MKRTENDSVIIGMNAFHNAMDQMIAAHETMRAHWSDVATSGELTAAMFAATFGTVRCTIGRQSGQTEYMIRRATHEDVIVVLTETFADAVRRLQPRCDVIRACDVWKMQQMQAKRAFRRIWVDEPEYVLKKVGTQQFYTHAANGFEQTFVMLGALAIH